MINNAYYYLLLEAPEESPSPIERHAREVIRMASINDWAAKAAERIDNEVRVTAPLDWKSPKQRPSIERIAAIIATYAEPLVLLLRGSKRDHSVECAIVEDRPCTCGANAWNARIDAALEGSTPLPRKRRVLPAIPGPLPRKGRRRPAQPPQK